MNQKRWARFYPGGYEVTSKGDARFSALFARLPDGRTIEEAYQLDVKGFRENTSDWRAAKGLPPRNGMSREKLWDEYLSLWRIWTENNPELFQEIVEIVKSGRILTDRFAMSPVNQAHALSVLAQEQLAKEQFSMDFE